MKNELYPLIDQWYAHFDKGQRFYVIDVNEEKDTIDIQNFDSDIDEFSFDEWRELKIELSDEPENWAGAMDIAEKDDLGTGITDTRPSDWTEPGKDFRPVNK